MSKWNESLVLCFLNVYRQHPCLWNPYDKDYYNCREKNEALRRIIEQLDVPGYTVNDYLQQIKMIREKYKQEQTRMIKSLRSRKLYRSPLPWYNTVADMLTKVIKAEEEAQQREGKFSLKSLSSDNLKDSQKQERVERDATTLKMYLCNNATCDSARRCQSAEKPSCLVRKRNSTTLKDKSDKRVRYVPCPQYSSKRDISLERDPILSHEPTRDTGPGTLGVPSTSMDPESSFLQCPSCGWEDDKYEKNFVPCPDLNKNLSSGFYTACHGCDQVIRDDLLERGKKPIDHSGDFDVLDELLKSTGKTEEARTRVDAGIQYSEDPQDVSKTRTQVIEVNPVVASNVQCGTIEACTRLKIIICDPRKETKPGNLATETVCRNTESVQCIEAKSSTKDAEISPEKIVCECTTCEAGVNATVPEEWNTVCVSGTATRCVTVQAVKDIEHEEKETEKYCETASKEIAVNIADQVSKAVQSTICVSRGSSACCLPQRKSAEIGTAVSVHRIRSVGCMTEKPKEFKSHFVQCKDRYLSLSRSKSFSSVKRCVRDTKHSADKETQGFADACTTDTCSLNILNLTREDPAVAVAVERLLKKLILFKRERGTQSLTDHEYHRVKRDCMIDATDMVNAIEEYARMLEPNITKDDGTQIQWRRYETERKPSFTDADTSTIDSKLTITDETMTESVLHSTSVGVQDNERRFRMVDKEVIARRPCKDAFSLTQSALRDAEIQSSATRLKDTGIEDSRERMSVGTQKRDPILVRVIRCSETQVVTRTDKETTMGTDVDPRKRFLKTCGRPTCVPFKVCRKSRDVRSPYCNMEREITDTSQKRAVAFNDVCDSNCKVKLSYDWTDVSNIDIESNVNSKIPTCARPCRFSCNYARSN